MDSDVPDTVWDALPEQLNLQFVHVKVKHMFPTEERPEVIRILDQYGAEAHEPERERVQLAIIKLSGGDLALLRQWVEAAKSDFRDALAGAEYPGQMQTRASSLQTDSATLRRIEAEDRRQYLAWLRAGGAGEVTEAEAEADPAQ